MRIFAWALMSALAAPSAGAQAGTANLSGDAAEKRVESILRQMTVEEKIDLIAGVDFFYLRGVPRLGVPRLRMVDGPMGVRNDGPATAYAGGIALAATWNTGLAERIGVEFGRDARAKGGHFLLAPGVNLYRASIAARNFEYFGEDPFLASRMAVHFIEGVQSQGVAATINGQNVAIQQLAEECIERHGAEVLDRLTEEGRTLTYEEATALAYALLDDVEAADR